MRGSGRYTIIAGCLLLGMVILEPDGTAPVDGRSHHVAPRRVDAVVRQRERARNVIVLQGDGLGAAQRDLIRLAGVGCTGELWMDRLDHAGLVRTDPDGPNGVVTDSAASATAFATGFKTFNGAVGLDAEGRPRPTLLEDAGRAGKATGLVTTAQVTDASPAAYAAHVDDRRRQSEIALQYLESSKPDIILGGGEDWWYPTRDPGAHPDAPRTDPTETSRSTHGNLVERAQELGYDYVTDAAELHATVGDKVLGLFANERMFEDPEEGHGDRYEPAVPLPEMAEKALELLSRDPDGFFVFIEEEAIDGMAHKNNARLMIQSGLAFDETVGVAVRFARRNPGTLIVAQGDHETGGLIIQHGDDEDDAGGDSSRENGPFMVPGTDLPIVAGWTTTRHTGAPTPITASGPGAEEFDGVIDNTEVHTIISRAMRGQ